ncbi:MAG: SDR family NAD(P)-dependent oxidoreductase [Solirubrobacteraceae bacterium]|nr:SDR family NAD(P)-dependent oxidoreductase [Solirubrobacteraceae bacterium]
MSRRRGTLRAGDHAVITGGSSGLGEALAAEFLAHGVHVTILARREQPLLDAASRLGAAGHAATVSTQVADVTDAAQLAEAFAAMSSAGRHVDVLVNSAGILREGHFETLPPSDFTDVMAVNFHGTVDVIRAALPSLQRRRGRIVNVASVAGLMGVFGYTPYAAAKHALVGFTNSLRYELEPQGIRVHLVCPGEFDSPMVAALDQDRTPENRAHTLTIPKSTPEAVARDTLRGIQRGRELIVPGRQAALAVLGQRLAPSVGAVIAKRRIAAASSR